jgi:GNAT superfamily N-acetyltransferase
MARLLDSLLYCATSPGRRPFNGNAFIALDPAVSQTNCRGRLTAFRPSGRQSMLVVRTAQPDDAHAAIDVVRRSITELCVADHHGDPPTLARWLANKTPADFVSWLSNPDNFCVVAEDHNSLSGIGLVHRSGEIRLFYLAPAMQRKGIGTAIHSALLEKARAWGLRTLHLESTALACPFYEALGYRAMGPAKPRFGLLLCFPYEMGL